MFEMLTNFTGALWDMKWWIIAIYLVCAGAWYAEMCVAPVNDEWS